VNRGRTMPARPVAFFLLILAVAVSSCVPPRIQPPGPAERPPALNQDHFVARDGIRLPVRAWLPAGEPEAVVLGVHGFNDYSNAFAMPAETWAGLGLATYAYDQRSFGATVYRGQWPGAERLARDLADVVAELRARHPGKRLVLVGESMGGSVAIAAAADPAIGLPVDGTVLVAPAVWGRETMPFGYSTVLWLSAHTLPWVRLTGRGLGKVASDNVEMLRALSADPLVIKETRVDSIYGLVNLMDLGFEAAGDIAGPVLVLYGENDEIVPEEPTRRMIESLPADGYRVAVYENGYHMLLRDLQRAVVHRDIAAWIADPAAPLPSGADGNVARFLAAGD